MKNDVMKLEMSVLELRQKVDCLQQSVTQVKPVYTTKEVVDMFGVKPQTLRRWRKDGIIGYSHLGKTILYSAEDIRHFMKTFHVGAKKDS